MQSWKQPATQNDGIDRRDMLKCMAWVGTGLLWTISSGVPSGRLFGQGAKGTANGTAAIVHDDIAWSSGMVRAWNQIREHEKDCAVVELYQGNRPSRGMLFYRLLQQAVITDPVTYDDVVRPLPKSPKAA